MLLSTEHCHWNEEGRVLARERNTMASTRKHTIQYFLDVLLVHVCHDRFGPPLKAVPLN